MIYYNLESEYPGDFTKHCGLTVGEVDSNFYELETMVHKIAATPFGKTRFYAFTMDYDEGKPVLMECTMPNETTCVVNGSLPDINGAYLCGFAMDNPYISGVYRALNSSLFVNDTSIHDITLTNPETAMMVPTVYFIGYLESYGDEFIMRIPNKDQILGGENMEGGIQNTPFIPFEEKRDSSNTEYVTIVTVNRGFDIRFEKNDEVVCGGRFVFGDRFFLEGEASLTEMLPDTEVCLPGTEIDAEHQSFNITGHVVELNVVCDISKWCGNEVVYYDYPRTFNFGFSLVPFSETLENDYPNASYSITFPHIPIPPKVTNTRPLWGDMVLCDGVKNLPLNLAVSVSERYSGGRVRGVSAYVNGYGRNIGTWDDAEESSVMQSIHLEIQWGYDVERYTFLISVTRGENEGEK